MNKKSMCDVSCPGTRGNADPAGCCYILQCCAITPGNRCPVLELCMQTGFCELEGSQGRFVIVISSAPGAVLHVG